MKFKFILFFIIPAFFTNTFAYAQSNLGDILSAVSPSVVTIETRTSTGSGVIIDDTGVIVTNVHVIEGETNIDVRLSNGDVYSDISIIDFDIPKDIVLLKIKGFDLPTSTLGNSSSLAQGDDVVVIGSPQGLEQSVTRGIISAIRDSGDGYRLIQTDAAISPGSSGGGMYNQSGELVGIVVSKLENAENISFVIPVNYVRGLFSTEENYSLEEFANLTSPSNSISRANLGSSSAYNGNLEQLLNNTGLDFIDAEGGYWGTEYFVDGYSAIIVAFEFEDYILTVGYPEIQEENVYSGDLTKSELDQILKYAWLVDMAKLGISEDNVLVVSNETHISQFDPAFYETIVSNVASLVIAVNLELSSSFSAEINNETTKDTLIYKETPFSQAVDLFNNRATVSLALGDWKYSDEQDVDPSYTAYSYDHTSGELFLKIITERAQLSSEIMLEALLENAQAVAPDATLIDSGIRDVNGMEFGWAVVEASLEGVPFTFDYHYYTSSFGSIQIMFYTYSNLYPDYVEIIDDVVSTFRVN